MNNKWAYEWNNRMVNKEWKMKNNSIVKVNDMSELHIKKCLSSITDAIVKSKAKEKMLDNPLFRDLSSKNHDDFKLEQSIWTCQIEEFQKELISRECQQFLA